MCPIITLEKFMMKGAMMENQVRKEIQQVDIIKEQVKDAIIEIQALR